MEGQDGQRLEVMFVTMETITLETDVGRVVLLKHTMMEEQNLGLYALREILWLQIIVMNGVAMDEDLMIRILSIQDEICFD